MSVNGHVIRGVRNGTTETLQHPRVPSIQTFVVVVVVISAK